MEEQVGQQLIRRFDRLSMNSKQDVAEKVIDKYFSETILKSEKLGNEYSRIEFKVGDIYTHKPSIATEKYQMSLWRVHAHMVVKVKYCYFTPSSNRFSSTDFSEFELSMGWDGTTIMLAESGPRVLQKLFMIFDIESFKLLNEQTIDLIDEEMKVDMNESSDQMTPLNVSIFRWFNHINITSLSQILMIFRTSILKILKYFI